MTKGTGRGQHVDLPDIMTKSQEKKSYFDVLHVIVGRNFTMVGKKNMGHRLAEIGQWKNRRYLTGST
jgi:hypothetical protein